MTIQTKSHRALGRRSIVSAAANKRRRCEPVHDIPPYLNLRCSRAGRALASLNLFQLEKLRRAQFLIVGDCNTTGACIMMNPNRRIFLEAFALGAGALAASPANAASGDGHAAGYDVAPSGEFLKTIP